MPTYRLKQDLEPIYERFSYYDFIQLREVHPEQAVSDIIDYMFVIWIYIFYH